MRKVLGALPVAVLATLGLGLAQPGVAAARTITVIEHATTDAVTDTGAKDDSAGDILTFGNEVFGADNKTKVGSDQGWCIRIVAGKSWECAATVMLDGGQITVEGPFLDAGDSVWAVTGGTGRYLRVHGEMKLHARDAKGSEYDFKFNLR
jgi:allene oxide cyclase